MMDKKIYVEFSKKYVNIASIRFSNETIKLWDFHEFYMRHGKSVTDSVLDTVILYFKNTDLEFYYSWIYEAPIWIFGNLENDGYIDYLKNKFNEHSILDRFYCYDNNLSDNRIEPKSIPVKSFPNWIGYTYKDSIKIDLEKNTFKKKFICLNNLPKSHREIIFEHLYENYLNDSYLSYSPMDDTHPKHLTLDNVSENFMESNVSATQYQVESFCNIVTETKYTEGIYCTHITEKVDKCFSSLQPFIIVSTPFYLKKLKELGFQTFDKWWDESYDEEFDSHERLNKIKKVIDFIGSKNINELVDIYKEMQPILDNNLKICKKYYIENKTMNDMKAIEIPIK